jgi:hypothetical protein
MVEINKVFGKVVVLARCETLYSNPHNMTGYTFDDSKPQKSLPVLETGE